MVKVRVTGEWGVNGVFSLNSPAFILTNSKCFRRRPLSPDLSLAIQTLLLAFSSFLFSILRSRSGDGDFASLHLLLLPHLTSLRHYHEHRTIWSSAKVGSQLDTLESCATPTSLHPSVHPPTSRLRTNPVSFLSIT